MMPKVCKEPNHIKICKKKSPNTWKQNNMFLNKPHVKEE